MAQLKDSIVSGNLRVTDEILTNLLQTGILRIPTSSGGTTYGLGTNGQIIKSNGSSVYWADDNNTNYYHSTGSWSGLTYTATANGGAPALAFTLPTGTTSTTVALGNHTHTTTIAAGTSSDTNQLTLTFGTKYKLTAGGTNFIFTTPSNPNTDRYVNSASFAHDSTNNNVKMTLTRAGSDTNTVTANIPKVSSSTAGVVPKGATVSNQSQSTKFLREDGTWAAPSYTTNTNTWRNIKVNGTEKLGTGTGTGALNFKNGTNTTVTYDSGIKINATDSKVTQTLNNNQGSYYPLLFSKKTIDDDAETTDTVYRSSNVYINPNGYLYTKNLQIGGGSSSGTLTLYGYSGGESVSGQLTQPFNGSGGTITHSLPITSGSLLNNTDFNNNRELQIYESLNSTMGQDDISYEVTNIKDKIKYVDIFFTDNNFHKGWSGGLNIISENYGYIRIPYDQISKDPLSDSSRFSLFLFGDESSYYLRKRTYYIYETEASSGVYNLYIAASTNNKDLLVQFYGTPGTSSWSNMTVRAQYSTGIKIYRVKLILDL